MNIPLIATAMKASAALLSLLLFVLSAALVGTINAAVRGYGRVRFDQGNACLAAGIIDTIYFAVVVTFLFIKPTNIFISLIVDVIILGFLFVLTLGSVAALSEGGSLFRACDQNFCGIAQGVMAIGWLLTILILAIIILEVVVTLRNYGGSLDTWKTPFNELLMQDTNTHGTRGAGGVEHRAETGATMTQTQTQATQPQVIHNTPQVVQNV